MHLKYTTKRHRTNATAQCTHVGPCDPLRTCCMLMCREARRQRAEPASHPRLDAFFKHWSGRKSHPIDSMPSSSICRTRSIRLDEQGQGFTGLASRVLTGQCARVQPMGTQLWHWLWNGCGRGRTRAAPLSVFGRVSLPGFGCRHRMEMLRAVIELWLKSLVD